MTKRSIFISILTINLLVSGESIVLKDGQIRTNSILDTSGCNVAIADNNKRIDIPKSTIDYCILLSGDTIRYVNYECVKKRQRIVQRDEDTPQSVLFRFLNSCKKTGTSLPQGCGISFLPLVIQGKSDASFTNPFFESLCEIKGKHLITQISTDSVLKSIIGQPTTIQYVFFIKRFEDLINTPSDNHFKNPFINQFNRNINTNKENEVFTVSEIAIADIIKKEILFFAVSSVKKTIWNVNSSIGTFPPTTSVSEFEKNIPSVEDLVLSDEQKNKRIVRRTERAKTGNGEKIVDDLVEKVSWYLARE